MKLNSKIAMAFVFAASLGLVNIVRADNPPSTPPAPGSQTGCHPGGHQGGGAGQDNAVFKAIHGAYAACKTAGVAQPACEQQLSTYLADFKPAN